jgi:hypothetical protein
MARWSNVNEGTIHNWFKQELDLTSFNRSLIDEHGTGQYFTIFDPSFLPKSGKKTPGLGRFWSGQAGSVKRGIEIGCFAVGDLGHRTAFHLSASQTPSPAKLKESGQTLTGHYVGLVREQLAHIRHFGNCLTADGYFGVMTFVQPVTEMGIVLISCLKSNYALFYAPLPDDGKGKPKRGRPKKKDGRINWDKLNEERLPIVFQNKDKVVRSALAFVDCLKRMVKLVAVDYLKEDGSLLTRKLYFCTDVDKTYDWILERYHGRYWIEFTFRDGKQFVGVAHCQSTDAKKIENHINLSLTAVSLAKAAHWLPLPIESRGAFSMAELKTYYHNLMLIDRFSYALGLDPTVTKNNPNIISILFSGSYEKMAA